MNAIKNAYSQLLNNEKTMKWTALLMLTFQNVSLVLLQRYVRSRPGDMFISSTAVAMSELVKLVVCIILIFAEESWNFRALGKNLYTNLFVDCRDNCIIGVPGIIYAIQNNLIILSVSHLNASLFQVSYQLKMFTTAIFFRIMLHRVLTIKHWLALFCLFIGVVLAQADNLPSTTPKEATSTQQPWFGFSCVVISCCLSGFAGVFFELVLKSTKKSVVIRNIQLSFYGILAGLVQVLMQDKQLVLDMGFFHGYDAAVWMVIFVQSLGGLLVAAVVRYADNILKNFATSVALILTLLLSVAIFNTDPSVYLLMGNVLVIVATVFYNLQPAPVLVAVKLASNPDENVAKL